MYKLSFVFLFLTLPFFGTTPLWGIPLWVYGSLTATFLYALSLIYTIEKNYDTLKEDHD